MVALVPEACVSRSVRDSPESMEKTETHSVRPEPVNGDLDANQSILLILRFDQLDHEVHHGRLVGAERLSVRQTIEE